jgi:uncharacterized damage-inducible protein DinB
VRELFDYDLWANLRWLSYLEESGQPDPALSILRHVLTAQEAWISRCRADSPGSVPGLELSEESIRRLNGEWKALLAEVPEDREVSFERTTGEPFVSTVGQIARHVLNHGTYHRGELRGLCRARGDDAFPETDLIAFKR